MPLGSQQPNALDAYVEEGLRNNLGLAQQRLAVERSAAVVRQARGLYLPSLGIDARYTERHGNVLDLGDLVNPAYAALNELLQRQAFPTDVDAPLPLTQETRLRMTQPLFQPAIVANHRLARTQQRLQGAQLATAARRLAAEIRTAYLNYARSTRLAELYEGTLPLVAENLRVNERLVSNGRATPEAIFRARAERTEVEQQLAAAEERRGAARRYFNFLLDRPLDAPVDLVPDSVLAPRESVPLELALRAAGERREELRQVDLGVEAARAQERLAEASFLPSVVAAVDYGVQGDRYRFTGDRDFALATLSLQWNLFNGGQDRARRQQATIDGQRLRTQRLELERQIALEVRQAHETAEVAHASIATADARLASAAQSYRLAARRYAEGLASLVEFIDARTTYTNAGLNLILTTYDYYVRRVELDRAAALYPVSLDPATIDR
jgi:outer membrane protein TolC